MTLTTQSPKNTARCGWFRRSAPVVEQRCAVYAAYSQANEIIYVGISVHPRTRWQEHECDKPWADEVKVWRVLAWYPNSTAARAQETHLIRTLCTRWNIDESPVADEVRARYIEMFGRLPGSVERRPRHVGRAAVALPFRIVWFILKLLAIILAVIFKGSLTVALFGVGVFLPRRRYRRRARRAGRSLWGRSSHRRLLRPVRRRSGSSLW